MKSDKKKSAKKKPKKYLIKVLKKDIDEGIVQDELSCPIALACLRKWKDSEVSVLDDYIERFKKGNIEEGGYLTFKEMYKLPKKATNFIYKFDREQSVKPFEFTISAQTEL